MAATSLTPPASPLVHNRTAAPPPSKRFLSVSPVPARISLSSPHYFALLPIPILGKPRVPALLAVADEEQVSSAESNAYDSGGESEEQSRPCELYVCNIPRSCDIGELTAMFQPFGTVQSVEVSRNPETGESRGCAYVTMDSVNGAKKASAALDGSDVGGREMRVRFSIYMNVKRENRETLNAPPKRAMIYETPYKIYVGNLSRFVTPEDLWNLFRKYGNVVSTRVLQDRKAGTARAYGFLSFSTPEEREAALSANGTELHGRKLVARVSTSSKGENGRN